MAYMILTQHLTDSLNYNKETGVFSTFTSRLSGKKEVPLGSKSANGYIRIHINNKSYLAHRLAWVYVYGSIDENLVIDHINGKRDDNRICNLRMVTQHENMKNVGIKHTPSKLQIYLQTQTV